MVRRAASGGTRCTTVTGLACLADVNGSQIKLQGDRLQIVPATRVIEAGFYPVPMLFFCLLCVLVFAIGKLSYGFTRPARVGTPGPKLCPNATSIKTTHHPYFSL